MRKVNLEVFAEFRFTLKETVEYLEWDQMQEIPCYIESDCDLDDLEEEDYIEEAEAYIVNAFEKEYGPDAIIYFISSKVISATNEKTNYTYYFN